MPIFVIPSNRSVNVVEQGIAIGLKWQTGDVSQLDKWGLCVRAKAIDFGYNASSCPRKSSAPRQSYI
jgi:hypothetical protein